MQQQGQDKETYELVISYIGLNQPVSLRFTNKEAAQKLREDLENAKRRASKEDGAANASFTTTDGKHEMTLYGAHIAVVELITR